MTSTPACLELKGLDCRTARTPPRIRTDQFLPPDDAQWAYEQAGQPKDIMWLDTTNHIDLYDNERFVAPAAERTASWFADHLKTA